MKVLALSVTLAVACIAGCRPAAPAAGKPGVIRQIGMECITEADVTLEANGSSDAAARAAALDRLTVRKRMVAEARATGLPDDPAVRRAVDGVLVRFLQERTLQPRLDSVTVDDRALEERYRKSAVPAATELSIAILFRASHAADTVRRQAHREQLAAIAAAIADVPVASGFGARAIEASEHTESRFQGGLIPPLIPGTSYGDWRDRVLAACTNLSLGEASGIIETADGLYVARLLERRVGETASFSQMKDRLRREALRSEEEKIRGHFAADLAAKYPVEPAPAAR